MKKSACMIKILAFTLAVLITACGNGNIATATAIPTIKPTEVPTELSTITNTPDPCALENIEAEVLKVHGFMREFDDESTLAASMLPRNQVDQLSTAIANLQKIRREAENQPTPPCLANLKTYQISHMNSVINALLAFLEGNQQNFDQSSALARQLHDQYVSELARILGVTPAPTTQIVPTSQTPSP